MDLEVIHALARTPGRCWSAAGSTVQGDWWLRKIAQLFDSVDRQFPGAVWSLSIGWGCEKLLTAAGFGPDPVGTGGRARERHGGLRRQRGDLRAARLQGRRDWSAPPGDDDVGLDAVASLPR